MLGCASRTCGLHLDLILLCKYCSTRWRCLRLSSKVMRGIKKRLDNIREDRCQICRTDDWRCAGNKSCVDGSESSVCTLSDRRVRRRHSSLMLVLPHPGMMPILLEFLTLNISVKTSRISGRAKCSLWILRWKHYGRRRTSL